MILTQSEQEIRERLAGDVPDRIEEFVDRAKRLGLLVHAMPHAETAWKRLDAVRRRLLQANGQYISLDFQDVGDAGLSEAILAVLEDSRKDNPFRINLPTISTDRSRPDSPFINRAILWEHLCDRLIEDEDRRRPTLMVLENVDRAGAPGQHDLARLIRFHEAHCIRRSFLLVLRQDVRPGLTPELDAMVDWAIDV